MASQPVATCIVFASRPSGKRLRISGSSGRPFRDLAEGEVLLQTLYLSLAPYMQDRKDNANSYAKTTTASSSTETVDLGSFGPVGRSATEDRFRHRATVF